jgi:hypothetical protein
MPSVDLAVEAPMELGFVLFIRNDKRNGGFAHEFVRC